MQRYIALRLIQGVLTVFVVVSVIFFLLRMAPGDPAYNLVGKYATPEQLDAVREDWGLNRPVLVQYLTYWRNVLRGDFGDSFVWSRPAADVVLARLPYTIMLAAAAMALTVLLSVPIGIASGLRRGGVFDTVMGTVSIVGQSMPDFWIGVMLVFGFALYLRLVPTSGYHGFSSIILPAATVSIFQIALVSRILRDDLARVMATQYILVARAKGLSGYAILWGHALKNASIPVFTVLGMRFAGMLNGVVVVEAVFSWPGLGMTALSALAKRDYPMIQATVISTALMTIMVNLVVDLIYTALDPRVRLGKSG